MNVMYIYIMYMCMYSTNHQDTLTKLLDDNQAFQYYHKTIDNAYQPVTDGEKISQVNQKREYVIKKILYKLMDNA